MKLKLQSKKKTSSVKKSTASSNKKKKEAKLKISSNYSDISEYKLTDIDIPLNRLKYNMIMYCDAKSITIPDGTIQLENSWNELVLLMLDTVRLNHPDNFIDYIMENGVTNQSFCVDTKYGKYSFEHQYKAYNLYDSGYYLEAIFDVEIIFWSIIRLATCLGIALDKMSIKLVNKDYSQDDIELTKLEEESIIVNISESLEYFNNGIFLRNMKMFSTHTTVHNIAQVLAVFCNTLVDNYDVDVFKKLNSNGKTRVTMNESEENSQSMEIRHTGWYIHTDLKPDSIIKFISDSMKTLNINKDDIKLYFKRLKKAEEKSEWEVD